MFSHPADIAFIAIYTAIGIALIFSIIFWRRKLDRWVAKKHTKKIRAGMGFWKFWGVALWDSLSKSVGALGLVATILPEILAVIHKAFPYFETFGLLHWISS